MDTQEKLRKLSAFKQAVLDWSAAYEDQGHRGELRSYINQSKVWVRQEVIEARCFHTLTIGPPPAVGGLVMQNVDPFAMIFDPPYGMSMVSHVVDMIDQTIGVLNTPLESKQQSNVNTAKIEASIERGYAFVAMAIGPDKPELEDVLDSIKEGASRCGIQAERVDEVQSGV